MKGQPADGLPPLREVIAAHGLSPRRGLGQNFIFDLNLTRRIAREAYISGAVVYEVGPGPGGLTRALLAEGAARIIAVERDGRAIPALSQTNIEVGSVSWPGCSNTIRGFLRSPSTSQIALRNERKP